MSEYGDPVLTTRLHPSTGEVMAAYVSIRHGIAERTEELLDAKVFGDFDADGKLIGIEILL